ncbi:MAG: methylated-DNA--[protein]-cysteine S-methyltransferase [Planctomycetota bacterium]
MSKTTKSAAGWYAVWPTAWGPIGATATEAGVSSLVLPHYQPDDLKALLAWNHPQAGEDSKPFSELIELSQAYFDANVVDFSPIACDLPKAFAGRVYTALRTIPLGRTRSYKDISLEIGREDAARAVATAVGKNPVPLVVPCHRVIYADGRLGGFSADGGPPLKKRMLDLEQRAINQ